MADEEQDKTLGLLQPAQKEQQGHPEHHFRNHDRREQQGVERVFGRELEADEGQSRQDADARGNHRRKRAEDKGIFKGFDNRFILSQSDEPAQADALHWKYAELLGVEGKHDDHDDGSEQKHIHEKGVDADQIPAEGEALHDLIPLKAFKDLVDSQVAVVSPDDDEQQ